MFNIFSGFIPWFERILHIRSELRKLKEFEEREYNLKIRTQEIEEQEHELQEIEKGLTGLKSNLEIRERDIRTHEEELEKKSQDFTHRHQEIEQRALELETLQKAIFKRDSELKELWERLTAKEKEVEEERKKLQEDREELSRTRAELENLRSSLDNKSREVEFEFVKLGQWSSKLDKLDQRLISKEKSLSSREAELKMLERELFKKLKSADSEREALKKRFAEAKALQEKTRRRREEVNNLLKKLVEAVKWEGIQEGKGLGKQGKPYKKKPPIERENKEPSTYEKKPSGSKQSKEVDLGDITRKKPKPAKRLTPVLEKEGITRIESPFVEINLDETNVFLVIPKQQFKSDDTAISTLRQIDYKLELNTEVQTITVKAMEDIQGFVKTEEKRIELEKPLKNFQVIFPPELQGRTYSYKHSNRNLYAFVTIGNNRGRMYYLYDKEGNINPIPKRYVCILLREDFELGTEQSVPEENWIWEEYRPFLIDLKETNELVARKQMGKEIKIPCDTTFSMEGEQVEDDFKNQTPLFINKSIKIEAPRENPFGWIVWIQHKQLGYSIIPESWAGIEALELKLPDDLPCECGEFQVDICNQDERVPVETLFFRYIPSLQIECQKELIIPDPYHGHKPEIIKVGLGSGIQDWELRTTERIEPVVDGYQITLPPEKDTLDFSISKRGKPQTQVRLRITMPRLKWKTSKQETWNDKPLQIQREELIPGTDFYLFICTNDFRAKYNVSAVLEANNEKLQETTFIRKGMTYSLLLNQFYDTIKRNIGPTMVKIKLWKVKEGQLLHEVEILSFAPAILRCRLCPFKSYDREEIISHIERAHLPDFIEPLTFEEMREYDSSLPHAIYKCIYCGFYVREDDPENPTSSIYSHIEKYCPKADRSKGYPKISFRIISNIDEIRENVIPSLPYFCKCKLCGVHFKSQDKRNYLKHLFENHMDKLYLYE